MKNKKEHTLIFYFLIILPLSILAGDTEDLRHLHHGTYPHRYEVPGPIPLIGQYNKTEYYMFDIITFVLDPEILALYIPDSLNDNQQFKENFNVAGKATYAQFVIYYPSSKIQDKFDFSQRLNLVFHPFAAIARTPEKPSAPQEKYFQTTIQAGIFKPSGIKITAQRNSQQASIDKIGSATINVHNGAGPEVHFSPDNMRLFIDNTRSVVDFWSFAYDNKNSTLTYHVIFIPRAAGDLGTYLRNKLEENPGQRLRDFLHETLPSELKHQGFSINNIKAWKDSNQLITKVFAEEDKQKDTSEAVEFHLIDIKHQIDTIKARLDTVENRLKQLQPRR